MKTQTQFAEVLWSVTRRLSGLTTVDGVLACAAEAINEARLYERAVLTLHDEAGNIEYLGAHGLSSEVVEAARRSTRMDEQTRAAILAEQNRISESYFVPAERDLHLETQARHVQSELLQQPEGHWQPQDELFVPIRNPDSGVIGFASVDTPHNGLRPNASTLRRLETLVRLAEMAINQVISQRKTIQAESQLHRLVTRSRDVIFRLNLVTNRIEFVNPVVEELTGYPLEFILNKPYNYLERLIVHPADLKKVRNRKPVESPRTNAHQTSELEFRVRRKDGSIRWVWEKRLINYDEDGQPVTVEATFRDITDQVRLRKELQQSEQDYRLLAENSHDLVYRCDRERQFVYVSPSVTRYLHAEPFEVVGTNLAAWLTDNPLNQALLEISPIGETTSSSSQPLRLELQSSTGEHLLMEFVENVILDRDGTVIGVQGVGRDVTDQVRVENELRRSERQYRELAELLPQTVFETDMAGRLTFVNRCGLRTFGYIDQDVIGRIRLADLFSPDHAHEIAEVIHLVAGGSGISAREFVALREDGSEFPVLVYADGRRLGNSIDGIRGVVVDLSALKAAERALQETEQQYTDLFEGMLEGVCIVDEREHIQLCNPALAKLFGASSAEAFVGQNILDYVKPEHRERVLAQTARRKQGEHSQYEMDISTVRGESRSVLVSVSPRTDTHGRYIGSVGAILDITERKRAEQRLRESEQKFLAIAEALPIPYVITRLSDGKVIFGNDRLIEAFGYEGDELTSLRSVSYYADPIDRDRLVNALNEHGEVQDMEICWKKADGMLFWGLLHARKISVDGEPAIVGGIIDITERKRVVEALRRSEETAHSLIDASGDAAMLTTIDGIVLAHNEQAAKFFRAPSGSLIGQDIFTYFSPAIAARNRDLGALVQRTCRPTTITESQHGRTYETTIHPILGATDEVDRVAVFARDITEERKMLANLRAKQKEVDRANTALQTVVNSLRQKKQQAENSSRILQRKSEELEEVVSMISHDLQGPLVSIRELAGLFRRKYAAQIDERGQQLARRISANAAQVVRMAESLVEYARSPQMAGKDETVDLRPLIKKIWLQVIDAFPGQRAKLHLPEESIQVTGSRLALERVLYNILKNSVAYVPAGREPQVQVEWLLSNDSYVMTVTDNGCGIPPEERQQVFELFYRGQSAPAGGTGIGLAVVKKIIEEAQGHIELDSTPEQGTTVRIILPQTPTSPQS